MFLEKLFLINFKNCEQADLEFSPTINCFAGTNGAGKTNLLDAIHYLSLCKSYFNPIDVQQIRYDEPLFSVQGIFIKNDRQETIHCGVKRHQKKVFKKNGKEYPRLADHVGLFPVVMITPYDTVLIMEGSEERRKFMDTVISQTDSRYLDDLILYNKALFNRNALLKRIAGGERMDSTMMEVLDSQLAEYGQHLFSRRKQFIRELTPVFNRHYEYISNSDEQVGFSYESQLEKRDFLSALSESLQRDIAFERTTTGIHKDDLVFTIHGGHPLKKFGSQGQQKTYLTALKLAQYSYLQDKKGFKPLLLLDDIFDKLDEQRITRLLEMVSHDRFGQIFLTDTDSKRVKKIVDGIGKKTKIFEVRYGAVREE